MLAQMAKGFELEGEMRLRVRDGVLPTLHVLIKDTVHECVSLKEACAFEYASLEHIRECVEFMYEVSDEELLRDNAEAATRFVLGHEVQNMQHSKAFGTWSPLHNVRVVSWDSEALVLRLMFSFVERNAVTAHVSAELKLMPITFVE